MTDGFKEAQKALLGLLKPGGDPVPNQNLRLQMARRLGQPVTDEFFYKVREPLLKDGSLGRTTGQGGKTFRAAAPAPVKARPSAAQADAMKEAHLMPGLGRYLSESFGMSLELPNAQWVVQDTSKIGPQSGYWERPDYTLVAVSKLRHLPLVGLDVHSFELKSEHGCNLHGVYEALNHTRNTDFGHLVWHLPEGSRRTSRLAAIQDACRAHGIGLILMRNPDAPELTEIVIDAVRKPTERPIVDEFIETRMSKENKALIAKAVKARRAA